MVIAAEQRGGEQILLIRELYSGSTYRYYAIRVKTLAKIPQVFTLIDGKPVEVK